MTIPLTICFDRVIRVEDQYPHRHVPCHVQHPEVAQKHEASRPPPEQHQTPGISRLGREQVSVSRGGPSIYAPSVYFPDVTGEVRDGCARKVVLEEL